MSCLQTLNDIHTLVQALLGLPTLSYYSLHGYLLLLLISNALVADFG